MPTRYVGIARRCSQRAGVSSTAPMATAEMANHCSWRSKFCCTDSSRNSRAGPWVTLKMAVSPAATSAAHAATSGQSRFLYQGIKGIG